MLISYVTAGTGHRRAAEAVAEAVRQQLPHAQVDCGDLLADVPKWFAWTYPRLYRSLVRWCPPLWGWGYGLVDQPWVFGGGAAAPPTVEPADGPPVVAPSS